MSGKMSVAALLVAVLFFPTLASGDRREQAARSADPLPLQDWKVEFRPSDLRGAVKVGEGDIAPQATTLARSHFIAMVPCRVVDTRNPDGPFGGPRLIQGATRTFVIGSGPCPGIPSNASAYSIAVGVTNTTGDGAYLTIWPSGAARPDVATITWNERQTLTTAAIVSAGTDGAIDVFAGNATHMTIDINGYFVEGVVTVIDAGSGLAGGGTGSVGLSVAPAGITSTELGPSAVTTGAIADAAVTGAKIANGHVVKSVKGLTDAVEITGTGGAAVSASGSTITIDAPPSLSVYSLGTSAGTYDLDAATPQVLCARWVSPAFHGQALVQSWVSATSTAGPFDLRMTVVRSTDGGATWTVIDSLLGSIYPRMSTAQAYDWATAVNYAHVGGLTAGSDQRFGIRLTRETSGGTTADPTAVRCEIVVQLFR